MNKFVTEIDGIFDIEFFQNVANSLLNEDWLSLSDPVALGNYTDRLPVSVDDHEYLKLLKEKYPKLNSQIKFLKSSKGSWPVHLDTHRKCAINIPVFNTQDTVTQFYEGGTVVDRVNDYFGSDFGTWYTNEYVTYIEGADLKFEHTLLVPTIINTFNPHGLLNNGEQPRIICSWAFNGLYEEAVETFSV